MPFCDLVAWRAAIGKFHVYKSMKQFIKRDSFLGHMYRIAMLLSLCVSFVLTSIFAISITISLLVPLQFFYSSETPYTDTFTTVYSYVKVCFYLPVHICLHPIAAVLATLSWLGKAVRTQNTLSHFYAASFILCELSNILYRMWVQQQLIRCSNDVETNPGPISLTSNCFKFCTWNLNSISAHSFSRVLQLEAYNTIHKHDLIAVTETHLDSSINLPENCAEAAKLEISGYQFIKRNHPGDTKRGGVGLYFKETLPLKERGDLEVIQECLVCEVTLHRKKIFFVVIYRSPSQNPDEFNQFLDQFEHLVSLLHQENPYTIVITGDFNCRSPMWWPDDIGNNEGELFEPLTSSLNLQQLICEPTHFIGNSKSCIDLILTDQPNLFVETGVSPSLDPLCHHSIIYGRINIKCPPVPAYTRKIWDYDKANVDAIQESLNKFPWEEHLSNLNPDKQATFLTETIMNVCTNYIPNKTIKVKSRDPPWMNRDIKNSLMRNNRAFKKYLRNGCRQEEGGRIEQQREHVKNAIEDAKHSYLMSLGADLANPKTGAKKYWSTINTFFNKNKFPTIPPLLVNDVFITNCTKKAQLFNDHFVQQCSVIDTGSTLPQFRAICNDVLDTCTFSEEDILKLIRSLDPNKAHGWDEISVRMIRLCDTSIVAPLKVIYRNCLEHGVFPQLWKKANIVPVHKKSSKQVIKNYRPISLLPIFGKLFEKLIFSSIYNHLEMHSLLSDKQSGFRPGDSTVNQLIAMTHEIYKAFDCNPPLDVRSVYLDISKAFDRVWHDGLIFKLRRNGIDGKLLKLIVGFLSDRQQRTVLNGKCSSWQTITAGVPQGSILGPLFFLIYINDLPDGLASQVQMFADDTSLLSVVSNLDASAYDLNRDLNLIKDWAYQWKMSFNPDPTKQAEQLIFSRKKLPQNHPPVYFQGTPVTLVEEHKHLGIILDKKLSFSAHIKEVLSKANRGIGMIKFLSRYLPRSSLDQIYKLHVRPHFDYCDVIYHVPQQNNLYTLDSTQNFLMKRLESMQYTAALSITGAWKGTSRDKIYHELGWESLSNRRWYRRLALFYKIVNGLTPGYLREILPDVREQRYGLRHSNSIALPRQRTEAFKNSFIPHCISLWNNLDEETRGSASLSIFKTRLISFVRPAKKRIFGIHNPAGLHLLTQLRVGLSNLREHRFRHNFRDTTDPMCLSNDGVEDTAHFLLLCHEYTTHRTVFLDRVNRISASCGVDINSLCEDELLNVILYGSENFPDISNKDILLATIEYVTATNRLN